MVHGSTLPLPSNPPVDEILEAYLPDGAEYILTDDVIYSGLVSFATQKREDMTVSDRPKPLVPVSISFSGQTGNEKLIFSQILPIPINPPAQYAGNNGGAFWVVGKESVKAALDHQRSL